MQVLLPEGASYPTAGDCAQRKVEFGCASRHGLCAPMEPTTTTKAALADWVPPMLQCQFFTPCPRHREQRKAEATFFCADCVCRPLCGHCTTQHAGHRLIQIRRYVYCDVVRATDMSPHMDISGVQTYIINQAKVMFLNQRPQSKMSRPGAADACLVCARTLREGCSYCSLSCKVEALAGGCGNTAAAPGSGPKASLLKHASGSASDSSDCWGAAPCSSGGANNVAHTAHADCSGDSSSSGQTLAAAAAAAVVAEGGTWGCSLQEHDHQQHSRAVGAAAAAWARRHSDSDSEARSSAGSYCARRKQASPRRSPLL